MEKEVKQAIKKELLIAFGKVLLAKYNKDVFKGNKNIKTEESSDSCREHVNKRTIIKNEKEIEKEKKKEKKKKKLKIKSKSK